jgi:hypothetical protein
MCAGMSISGGALVRRARVNKGRRAVVGEVVLEVVGCAEGVEDLEVVRSHMQVAKREVLQSAR